MSRHRQFVRLSRAQRSMVAVLAYMLAITACAAPTFAQGKQQLVRAGHDWGRVAQRAEPGNEIILMPGKHLSATLSDIAGTEEQPIVIRGVDPRHPVEIDCDLYGIRLRNCRHIRLENITISGARIAGILIEGEASAPTHSSTAQSITLRNVHINETGPSGQRHAVHIRHADDVRIESSTISGWAGSGIEAVAVHGLVIQDCVLQGTDTCTQTNGIRLRGGTRNVRIVRTVVRDAGDHGICIGGASRENEVRTPPEGEAIANSRMEASSVEITDCLIEGGRCSVAFVHAADVHVHRSTLLRPRQVVVSIRRDREGDSADAVARSTFGDNIIAWQPGDLEAFLHIGRSANTDGLELTQNLWWGGDASAVQALGPFPGKVIFPQQTDVDPELDADGRAGRAEHQAMGRPVREPAHTIAPENAGGE